MPEMDEGKSIHCNQTVRKTASKQKRKKSPHFIKMCYNGAFSRDFLNISSFLIFQNLLPNTFYIKLKVSQK